MDATKFKLAFAAKTHAAFGTWTFGNANVCDGEDWAKVLTPVLTEIGKSAGYKALPSRQKDDSPYSLIYTIGNEESPPQVYLAHAIHREEEYGSDGAMVLLEKCAQTPASVRVAIGYSKDPEDAYQHGEFLVKQFIERGISVPPNSELLLILGWDYYYTKNGRCSNFGWHSWCLPRNVGWIPEKLAEKASPQVRDARDDTVSMRVIRNARSSAC